MNALALELRAAGLAVVLQYNAQVFYKDMVVGEYFLDLMVVDVLLVELKIEGTGRHASNAMHQLPQSG